MGKCCFENEYDQFGSQEEFEQFEKILNQKIQSEVIKPIPQEEVERLKTETIDHLYQCNFCEEKYALSFPDNTWRGYFLEKSNAIEEDRKRHLNAKNKRIGYLVFVIFIVIIIALLLL